MKKIVFSNKLRRLIIILMIVNSFALFVNYFAISPKYVKPSEYNSERIDYTLYAFTDSQEINRKPRTRIEYVYKPGWSSEYSMYKTNPKYFWPFTSFYKTQYNSGEGSAKFRGVFADFDHSEFLFYSLLIFGVPLVKKLW